MALFQPIAGNLSGSVGGNTYSHNKGGAYVRRRSVPTNPTTARQTAVRTQMSTNSRAWNALTNVQRAAWSTYANANPTINRLGAAIRNSGIATFNRINNISRDSGNGQISSPPAGVGPASLSTIGTPTNVANVLTFAFTGTPLPSGARLAIRTTGPGRASQNPNARAARLVGYSAAAQSSPVVITLPYSVSAGTFTNLYVSVVDAFGRESPSLKIGYLFT